MTAERSEERGGRGRRGGRREGRGIVSVLLGTAVLGLLGFGFGIVAGLFLEEPGLLLDYLTGRTTTAQIEAPAPPETVAEAEPVLEEAAPEEVAASEPPPVSDPAPPPEPPPVAAPPPAPVAAAAPAPVAPAPPENAETPAAAPRPAHPGQSGYSVQVGALADSASAEQLASRLEQRGFAVYVAPSAEPGARRWRVRVGPVATREEAQRLAEQLGREKLPTWVLAEGRR